MITVVKCGHVGHYGRREWMEIARLPVALFMLLSLLVVVF